MYESRFLFVATALALSGPAAAQSLALSGYCGEAMNIDVSGATPGGSVALVTAADTGSIQVPGGPCAGTEMGLSSAGLKLRGQFGADASGQVALSPQIPPAACGLWVEALDLATCTPTGPQLIRERYECWVEDFEGPVWPSEGWQVVWGLGTLVDTAYEGEQGLADPHWWYNDQVVIGVGEKLTGWFYASADSSGRAHLGFDAGPLGAKSLVLATNTNELRLENNPDYNHELIDSSPFVVPLEQWLQLEIEITSATRVSGQVLDTSGTPLARVSGDYAAVGGVGDGHVAIRSFGGFTMDLLESECPAP